MQKILNPQQSPLLPSPTPAMPICAVPLNLPEMALFSSGPMCQTPLTQGDMLGDCPRCSDTMLIPFCGRMTFRHVDGPSCVCPLISSLMAFSAFGLL
jgi:hypothetical protein